MSSPVRCPRHGRQQITLTSSDIATRIKERGQFEAGQLVKVSLDRPKRSKEIWMTESELSDHAPLITYVEKIAHLKDFPTIAAIERSLVWACSRCMDELLVRSGEEPARPTSRESAFDTAVVAEDANVSDDDLICPIHGVAFTRASSPRISQAIDSGAEDFNSRLIKTVLLSGERESVFWFDVDFLRHVLGREIDLTSSTLRLENEATREMLMEEATIVCSACLRDFLTRSGVES